MQTPPAKITALNSSQARRLAASLGLPDLLPSPSLKIDVGVAGLIADLDDSETVTEISPRLDDIAALSVESQAAGITVFGRTRAGVAKLHARSFAPALGVAEDPVCGSGNAAVGAYLAHIGLSKKSDQTTWQGREWHWGAPVKWRCA